MSTTSTGITTISEPGSSPLRQVLTTSPQTDAVATLIDELLAGSPDFASRWARADVGSIGRSKVVVHPELRRFTVDCDVLSPQDSSLKLMIYSAPLGSPDAQALALLATIGSQRFAV